LLPQVQVALEIILGHLGFQLLVLVLVVSLLAVVAVVALTQQLVA
jgi:hypothetical protein